MSDSWLQVKRSKLLLLVRILSSFAGILATLQWLQVSATVTASVCFWVFVVNLPAHRRLLTVALTIDFITTRILTITFGVFPANFIAFGKDSIQLFFSIAHSYSPPFCIKIWTETSQYIVV